MHEPGISTGKALDVPVKNLSFIYPGGNLLGDTKGNCFRVMSERGMTTPEFLLKEMYGCKTLTALPYLSGVGDIDERIKFLSDDLVVTDTTEYAQIFSELNYRVVTLPKPFDGVQTPPAKADMASYINALLVNGRVFVPQFETANDRKAASIYGSLGLEVFGTSCLEMLAHEGLVHCYSMNYPVAPAQ